MADGQSWNELGRRRLLRGLRIAFAKTVRRRVSRPIGRPAEEAPLSLAPVVIEFEDDLIGARAVLVIVKEILSPVGLQRSNVGQRIDAREKQPGRIDELPRNPVRHAAIGKLRAVDLKDAGTDFSRLRKAGQRVEDIDRRGFNSTGRRVGELFPRLAEIAATFERRRHGQKGARIRHAPQPLRLPSKASQRCCLGVELFRQVLICQYAVAILGGAGLECQGILDRT